MRKPAKIIAFLLLLAALLFWWAWSGTYRWTKPKWRFNLTFVRVDSTLRYRPSLRGQAWKENWFGSRKPVFRSLQGGVYSDTEFIAGYDSTVVRLSEGTVEPVRVGTTKVFGRVDGMLDTARVAVRERSGKLLAVEVESLSR